MSAASSRDIAGRRFVQMRIDPLAHQLVDHDVLAANLPGQIGHHAGRADQLDRPARGRAFRRLVAGLSRCIAAGQHKASA